MRFGIHGHFDAEIPAGGAEHGRVAPFPGGVFKRLGFLAGVGIKLRQSLVVHGADQFAGRGLRQDISPDLGLFIRATFVYRKGIQVHFSICCSTGSTSA